MTRADKDRRIIEDMMGVAKAPPAVKSKRLTLKDAKEKLRGLDITITRKVESGEYRVNFKDGKEATAYYATDLDDAIGTGQAMANNRDWGDDPLGAFHGRNE